MRPPRFSVIIPAYNSEATVVAAIQSVLNQTEQDFEVCVVNDGSIDGTQAAVGSVADPRIHRCRQSHRGVSAARNLGIRSCQGELVTFLDSDDEAHPGWLAELGSLLVPDEVGIAFCGMLALKPGQPPVSLLPKQDVLGPGLFLAGCYAVRRSLLAAVGGFDERLCYSENTDLGFRLVEACTNAGLSASATEKVLVTSNRPSFSKHTTPARLEHQIGAVRLMLAKHEDLFRANPGLAADYLAVAGVAAARLGRLSEARGLFGQAIHRYPRRAANYARLAVAITPWLAPRVWGAVSR